MVWLTKWPVAGGLLLTFASFVASSMAAKGVFHAQLSGSVSCRCSSKAARHALEHKGETCHLALKECTVASIR